MQWTCTASNSSSTNSYRARRSCLLKAPYCEGAARLLADVMAKVLARAKGTDHERRFGWRPMPNVASVCSALGKDTWSCSHCQHITRVVLSGKAFVFDMLPALLSEVARVMWAKPMCGYARLWFRHLLDATTKVMDASILQGRWQATPEGAVALRVGAKLCRLDLEYHETCIDGAKKRKFRSSGAAVRCGMICISESSGADGEHAVMAKYLDDLYTRFSGFKQFSLAYDASTFGGEPTTVFGIYSHEARLAAWLPPQALSGFSPRIVSHVRGYRQ